MKLMIRYAMSCYYACIAWYSNLNSELRWLNIEQDPSHPEKIYRTNQLNVFCKKNVFKSFAKLTENARKTPVSEPLFWWSCKATLLKNKLWYCSFPMNFANFLRTPFLKNAFGGCFWKWLSFYFNFDLTMAADM